MGINLSTNLNVILQIYKDDWVDILKSGLEYLIVSLDGTDQETYGTYKVKGNFHTVIKNMKKIIERRRELKSKNPVIEWQFIVMKHNIYQVEEATRMAKEMGVDVMRFIPVGLSMYAENKEELAKKWFPEQNSKSVNEKGKYRKDMFAQKVQRGPCFYLYRSVTINPIGCDAPCCVVWKKEDDFGNILNEDFKRIWNNQYYISARSIFSRKGFKSGQFVRDVKFLSIRRLRTRIFYQNENWHKR